MPPGYFFTEFTQCGDKKHKKEGDEEMPLLELLVQEPGLQPPGDWHGDVLSVWPSLGAIAVLSERAVPTYFPDVTRDWGAGRECIVSTAAGTGKKRLQGSEERGSQMDDMAYHKVRQLVRWERVRASGSNKGEGVAVVNAVGGDLGVTSSGNARAGPRRQGRVSVGDPRRAVVGARPTQRRGSVTYFDTAGPHRGPGCAKGDPPRGGVWSSTPRGRRGPGRAMGTRRMCVGHRRRRRATTASSSTREGEYLLVGTALRVSGSPTRSRRWPGRQRRGERRVCGDGGGPAGPGRGWGLSPSAGRGEGWVLTCTC